MYANDVQYFCSKLLSQRVEIFGLRLKKMHDKGLKIIHKMFLPVQPVQILNKSTFFLTLHIVLFLTVVSYVLSEVLTIINNTVLKREVY